MSANWPDPRFVNAPYVKRELDGLAWQDAAKSGRGDFPAYMDLCVDNGGYAETLRYAGRVVGGGGFAPFNKHWWSGAIALVEGAPRIVWRHAVIWQRALIAHAVRAWGVRRIDCHVLATFAEGHKLAMLLGFRFVGLDQGLDGSDRLLVRYATNGPLKGPDMAPALAAAMRAAHAEVLRAYAPAALRLARRVGDA